MQTKLQITLLKISANNLSNLGAQDYLKFINADKVTDKAVENFCKQFVEKIFSRLYNAYWMLDVAVLCLFVWTMLFRPKNAQFINFSKLIKSCFETIIVIFCPKYDNQTGLPTHSDSLKSQTFILWCNLMKIHCKTNIYIDFNN